MSGLESIVDKFLLKDAFLKSETEEFKSIKETLRGAALTVIRAAKEAGVKRAYLRSSRRGGVLITLPDYTKLSNRPVFNDKKLAELMKLGGLEELGLKPEEVFEEEREGGGEVIELRGRWIEWFKAHFPDQLKAKDPDLKWENREPTITRRVKLSVLSRIEAAMAAGSAVAAHIYNVGFASLKVRAEDE
jgi:hypothetical protein